MSIHARLVELLVKDLRAGRREALGGCQQLAGGHSAAWLVLNSVQPSLLLDARL